MTPAQTRLDNAILAHEEAAVEVDRLCDIVERAVVALARARQTKRDAHKELEEAEALSRVRRRVSNNTERQKPDEDDDDTEEDPSEYSDEGGNASSESDEDEELEEEDDDDDDRENGFDMGNEALEQIRYRLETAKIDPNSPGGTRLLDNLLLRLQETQEAGIGADLINEFIDEYLREKEEPAAVTLRATGQSNGSPSTLPRPQNPEQRPLPRLRIHRGGKALGYYQGGLDTRGYARQGRGSMYYDAGHECHGTWKNDEMVGRGVYRWSDGHRYDGEWRDGKRHGRGRFVRPDGVILYGIYERGRHKGEGVRWSADRREVQVVVDGVPKRTVSSIKAEEMVRNLGFEDVLPPPASEHLSRP